MMTAVMERVAVRPGRRVLVEIARFEARRLWRNPALTGAVVVTAYQLYQRSDLSRAPVLNRLSYQLAWPMLLLAGGIYLALGSAASRRHGVDNLEGLEALPTNSATNSLGVGLAFLSPLLAGIALQFGFLVPRLFDRPVTPIIWAEFLTGSATVALGAAAGLAVGWGLRWRWALPVFGVGAVAAITTVWWARSGVLFGRYTPWLAPVSDLSSNEYAYEQMYRPSGPHLAYVLSMTAVFAVLALLRGRSRTFKFGLVVAALGLAATTVFFGQTQLREPTSAEEAARRAPYLPGSGDYVCEERGPLTLCAYRGYEPWIEEWAAQIEPVLALVPPEVAARPLKVRQQITYFVDEDVLPQEGDVPTGLWWSPMSADGNSVSHPLGVALAAAAWTVGLPTHQQLVTVSQGGDQDVVVELVDDVAALNDDLQAQLVPCSSHGQARGVAALWYAAQGSTASAEGLRLQASEDRYGGVSAKENFAIDLGYLQPGSSVAYFRREAQVALAMAEHPQSQVSLVLMEKWVEMTSPLTTTETIASWFGVAVPSMNHPDDMHMVPCT